MVRKLLATSALTVVLASGAAFAEDAQPDAGMAKDHAAPIFQNTPDAQAGAAANDYLRTSDDQVLASTLIGKSIYNGFGRDAESIGDVNDIVMSKNGQAEAVVVGVGGFLGIGEKDVAVSFDRLSMTNVDNETRLTIDTTAESLEKAPAFNRSTVVGEASGDDAMTTKDDQTAAVSNGALPATKPGNITEQSATTERQAAMSESESAAPAPAQPMDTSSAEVAKAPKMATEGLPTDGMVAVDQNSITANDLIGTAVMDANQEEIGEISGVVLATDDKSVEAYLVDVGGFLGIGEKRVAFAAEGLDIYKDETGVLRIYSHVSEQSLDSVPEFDEQTYRTNPESILVR